MSNFLKKDLKIVEKHKIWFSISLGIILLGIIMFTIFAAIGGKFSSGLNLGIDFTGGTQLDVEIGSAINDENREDIKNTILNALDEFGITDRNEIQYVTGDREGYSIVYRANSEQGDLVQKGVMNESGQYADTVNPVLSLKGRIIETIAKTNSNFDAKITSKAMENDAKYDYIKINPQTVSAKASRTLVLSAVLSVLVASVLILIYVAFRFELSSGIVAVAALLHDVLIMIAFMAIVRMQINSTFIAALITIIGYSINATIIIFDRIRENAKKVSMKEVSPFELVNKSVKQTLTRTINTTITTLFTIVMLFILGVPSIKEFALPIIIGLIAGTYSSILISPSMWAVFKNWQSKKKGKTEYFAKKVFKRTERTDNTAQNETD